MRMRRRDLSHGVGEVEGDDVDGALGEEELVRGVVDGLAGKVPDVDRHRRLVLSLRLEDALLEGA